MSFLLAVVQMTSTGNSGQNVEKALKFIEEAADRGASIIGLPENWSHIRDNNDPAHSPLPFDGGIMGAVRDLCKKRKITLVAGTIPEAGPGDKIYNTCLVIGPDGEIIAGYRKIHLFDVFIKDGAYHQESKVVAPGDNVVTVDTVCGRIGLAVCYDLRFPELFRKLTLAGARVIFVPSAFTLHTGKDHWLPLLRARAIENLAYIAAPAQFGRHSATRRSFGKSLIADPWGTVTAMAEDRECIVISEIDYAAQDSIREQLPCLSHIKSWLIEK